MENVLVVGLWHQGIVAAACLADWGYKVLGVDVNKEVIKSLRSGRAPIYEPHLDELLAKGLQSNNLSFSIISQDCAQNANVVLIAHDTPVDANDLSDLEPVFSDIKNIAGHLSDGVVVHITAQVPVGSCDQIIEIIKSINPKLKFLLAYSPENLRLGQAIERFKKPMLPIIGSDNVDAYNFLSNFYKSCQVEWQFCSLRTAEMSKHALNAFLATSVTFANELGNLCDEVGADGHRLAQLLRLEPRIGSKAMLMPGLGFSGGTLARDIQTLRQIGKNFILPTTMFDGVWAANQHQNQLVVRKLSKYFGAKWPGINICVFGLTYKPDTSTLRRSASIEIISELVKCGAHISSSDPMADREELKELSYLNFYEDPIAAARGADALVLITPWNSYKDLNFNELSKAMRGKLILDTANLWNRESVQAAGFEYINIGGGIKAGDSK